MKYLTFSSCKEEPHEVDILVESKKCLKCGTNSMLTIYNYKEYETIIYRCLKKLFRKIMSIYKNNRLLSMVFNC